VLKKVEQIIDYLFIDTYKANKLKYGKNEIRVNNSEMITSSILKAPFKYKYKR